MAATLGDTLREAREAKGMTKEQLASVTKLNIVFIDALEDGRYDLLPGEIYLKPFTKACAEILELNIKELYKLIDGEIDAPESGGVLPERAKERKFDYKLPTVIIVALLILTIIYFTVISIKEVEIDPALSIIPAETHIPKGEIKWQRPWEKPSEVNKPYMPLDKFRLVSSDSVLVCVVSKDDTLFNGYFEADDDKTFSSYAGFTVSLSRNDCVRGYLNENRIREIGRGRTPLDNLAIGTNMEVIQ